ncbi:MAG: tRNA (adenosine(37)-N6)-threonylcarbamoyltransferase complex dimerization subunit type 1 TsaB [Candidatus Omnitrophica bacterium]|nr:tRNA (adenosine(37)-N6)-threonylcarbamoyltransferase complex dimerization subunit type 1 TsaB [Candidatus Omnitrophota bacterium]
MKIIGIDTSTKFLCIGVFDGTKIYDYRLNLGKNHGSLLFKSLKQILRSINLKLKYFDYLAVGLGPGSFTGVRIAISVAKGLAITLKKKIVGISTLDIIAYNALNIEGASFICPILDAKRNLIYTSLYQKKDCSIRRIKPYLLFDIESLIKMIPKGTVILGDAVDIYRDKLILKIKDIKILEDDFSYPRGTSIIKLSQELIKEKKFTDVDKLKPLYLYPKECQIKR